MTKKFTERKVNGIIIESNVPFPEYSSSYRSWPFAKMEVGESFAVAAADVDKVRAAASYAGSRASFGKFSVRKTPGEAAPYRCWRVE